jgi:hypothetical protein
MTLRDQDILLAFDQFDMQDPARIARHAARVHALAQIVVEQLARALGDRNDLDLGHPGRGGAGLAAAVKRLEAAAGRQRAECCQRRERGGAREQAASRPRH